MQSRPQEHSRWYLLLAICAGILCLQAVVVWVLIPIGHELDILPPSPSKSADLYLEIAENLVAGNGFKAKVDMAETMYRGPGYVLFLAGLVKLFPDQSFTAISLANLLLTVLVAWFTFILTRRLSSNATVAALAALLVCFHPAILLVQSRTNMEIFYSLLLMLYAFSIYRAVDTRRTSDFLLAGLVLGIACLSRSAIFFSIPLFLVYYLYAARKHQSLGRSVVQIGAFVLVTLLVVSPWAVRNYQLSGKLTFSENLLGVAAYQGQYITRNPKGLESYGDKIRQAARKQRQIAKKAGISFDTGGTKYGANYWETFPTIEDEIAFQNVLFEASMEYYREDPFLIFRHSFYNSIRFWFLGATPTVTALGLIVQVPMMLLAAYGAFVSIRRKIDIWPILIIGGTIYAIHIPLIAHARYSTPLIPFVAIFIGIGLSQTPVGRWQLPGVVKKALAS
jgi:4-amino-4-deoxy-L-arabinose transferase-like glycosyltransferase